MRAENAPSAGPWRRLWRKVRPGRTATDSPRAAVMRAIAQTRARQAQVASSAGRAFVQRAEIESALARQADVLLDAAAGIRDAMQLAEHAGQAAGMGGSADVRQYEQTVTGLQSQLAVVEQARGQLRTAQAAAEANIDSARAMLQQNVASLDRALRDEVRLLSRLEGLERERVIAEARRRR